MRSGPLTGCYSEEMKEKGKEQQTHVVQKSIDRHCTLERYESAELASLASG